MNYNFGFSWKGFVVVLLPMIPNVFYFFIPVSDVSGKNGINHLILDVLEHGSQVLFIIMLILIIKKQTSEFLTPHTIGMSIMLIFYYVLWIFYFAGKANLVILLGMAVFPGMKLSTSTISNTQVYQDNGNSYFDGGLLQYIGWSILGGLVTIFTLGICYPWAITMILGWKTRHTVINGRRLQFNGSAIGLFGNWIKWWFFCLITLGIYSFWLFIAMEKWKTKHTTFVE